METNKIYSTAIIMEHRNAKRNVSGSQPTHVLFTTLSNKSRTLFIYFYKKYSLGTNNVAKQLTKITLLFM